MSALSSELPMTVQPGSLISVGAVFFVLFFVLLVRFVAIPAFFGRRV